MSVLKKHYLQKLSEFVQSGSLESLYRSSVREKIFEGLQPEEIVALHEDCMQIIVSNLEWEEAIKLYHYSFVFLVEVMVNYQFGSQYSSDADNSSLVDELRSNFLKSYRSSQMVKNKYENILQHMDSGIILFDSGGFLSFMNIPMAKFLGIPRKTLLGCDLPAILRHPKLSRQNRKLIRLVYKEMFVKYKNYYEFTMEDGRQLLMTATYGDELEGDILISAKDMTDFKKIEQSAYQNDKLALLGKIAASIAHEIRNPLTSIRGFIQLLQPHLVQLGKEDYARIILEEIDRANDIIFEFLNSSKPSVPNKREVPVAVLMKEAVLLSESEAILKSCRIECEPIDPGISVWIDVKQIKQVLLNIIKNAVDAISDNPSQKDGLISIRVERSRRFVHILIRDNGKGMDTQTQSRLFDPFFTTKQEGTGLGLSVCYRIIKNHGGTVQVNSQLGAGTEFELLLPVK